LRQLSAVAEIQQPGTDPLRKSFDASLLSPEVTWSPGLFRKDRAQVVGK
jgi:hypothetical protein